MLENVEGAAFIVTKEARVQTLNREAEGMLRKADILRIRPDKRLAFNMSKIDEDFQAAIAAVFDPLCAPPPTSFAIHYGLPGQKIVTVLPLRPGGATRLALLLIYAVKRVATPASLLQSLHSLTKAEAEVVSRIANGNSPSAIAKELMVAKVTIRNHLASAMQKLGVHSQAQIAALVSSHGPRLKLVTGGLSVSAMMHLHHAQSWLDCYV
jgi:DNA-binding CsgD family transcriptional regulator